MNVIASKLNNRKWMVNELIVTKGKFVFAPFYPVHSQRFYKVLYKSLFECNIQILLYIF